MVYFTVSLSMITYARRLSEVTMVPQVYFLLLIPEIMPGLKAKDQRKLKHEGLGVSLSDF